MIDYVRMNYENKSGIEAFILDEKNFPSTTNIIETHSGELLYPYRAKVQSMDIKVTKQRVCVSNSLHKLHNFRKEQENRNHNDFLYSDLVDNINFLDKELLDLKKSNLSKLEFGLNIELDIPAENVIKKNIYLHKFKTHSQEDNFSGKGYLKRFNYANYSIKIYDKAKQYFLPNNILRFEINYRNSKIFSKYNISNIINLKSKDSLRNLFKDLMQRFDEMVIVDDFSNNSKLADSVKNNLQEYTSYDYWEKLSSRSKRNKKAEELKNFKSILKENDLLKTKSMIEQKLISKFNHLIEN